ncbi:hypothetical protein JCM9279_006977 [Rhodotorula babjevae]
MAFLWGASAQQQEWDQLIDKATSDLLPANSHVDLPDALHLADLLRSAQVPAQHATTSLVQRLRHPNPNVQLLALELADLCVKNGGTPFLVAFSRGAADHGAAAELELLARGVKAGGGVHRDVKERVLARLQDWATAFKAKAPSSSSSSAQLFDSELVRVYDRLVREGVDFPPRDPTATAAMVDSLSAPDWADAPYCTRCRTDFSTFNRKHHCRNCGNVFDAQCSSGQAPLPHYGILEPVRVCDGCLKKVREGKGASVVPASTSASAASPGLARSQSFGGAAAAAARDREDDDLRRAIEASLKDVEPDSLRRDDAGAPLPPAPVAKSGYNPSYAAQVHGASDSKRGGGAKAAGEDDDPDLAAAIAASLRDLQPPATAPAFARSETASTFGGGGGAPLTYAQMFPSSTHEPFPSAHANKPAAMALPSYDLTPAESATLGSFVALYAPPHGHPHAPPPPPSGGYLGARERGLYDEARGAQGRLARAEEDARRRGEILREMEWKLSEAARLYGAGLTERASYRPTASTRTSSYLAQPVAPQPLAHTYAPEHEHDARRYQYAPPAALAGQPLPAYAVPPTQPQHAEMRSPPPQLAQQQQYEHPQQHHEPHRAPPQSQHQAQPVPVPVPVPAGFYKPSQFPSVPSGPAAALFPSVPHGEPWRRGPGEGERELEEEEEREEVREEARTGELIEL